MSKVKIEGNASGTGTLTISAPNTDTDRSITLPDEAGEVLVNGTSSSVGIGTSSPKTTFQVGSTGVTSSVLSGSFSAHQEVDGDAIFFFMNSLQSTTGSTNETCQLYLGWRDGADGVGVAPRIVAGKEGDYKSVANADSYLAFNTVQNNALKERLRIGSGGGLVGGSSTETTGSITWSNYGSGSLDLRRYADPGNVALFRDDLTLSGTISVNGSSCSYNTSSDYRLKENVVDMDGAIDRVKALQPKRFNWIADEDDTTIDGFLAHEAQTVVPEAVTGTHNEVDEDDNPVYQGIDQSKLVPLLTGALQEAIAKIEALETRIEALENA